MADLVVTLRPVPVDRVVYLSGVSAEGVAAATARCAELPAAVVLEPPAIDSVAAFVAGVLDALDAVARQLLPAWLPEADGLDGPQGSSLMAIRAVAIERARVAGYPSTFLADLAERALTGRPSRGRLRPEARVAGLARVVASGFRRDRLVLVMPAAPNPGKAAPNPGKTASSPGRTAPSPGQTAGNVVVAGSEWLADRGRLGVWLTGAGPSGPERVGTVRIEAAPPVAEVEPPGPEVALPSPARHGRPHPRSTVEAALEAVLARQEWAYGRIWNGTYQPTLIHSPIRPDLLWPAERVVVELDGLEHCRPDQYDADRVRDVRLQLDGYAVLRFTNARVKHDVQAVATQIEHLIRTRRQDIAKGQQGG